MPKLKTHKGAKARFHITGSGKVLRMKAHRSHLRRKKPMRVHRQYHAKLATSPADQRRIRQALPYI